MPQESNIFNSLEKSNMGLIMFKQLESAIICRKCSNVNKVVFWLPYKCTKYQFTMIIHIETKQRKGQNGKIIIFKFFLLLF
jgi:hypothetical protein